MVFQSLCGVDLSKELLIHFFLSLDVLHIYFSGCQNLSIAKEIPLTEYVRHFPCGVLSLSAPSFKGP